MTVLVGFLIERLSGYRYCFIYYYCECLCDHSHSKGGRIGVPEMNVDTLLDSVLFCERLCYEKKMILLKTTEGKVKL